jgi:sulfate permease, SulP family
MNKIKLQKYRCDISLVPFVEEMKGYCPLFFRDDILAALSVAFLTIPQSIAYSLLAGLPPSAGLFSAIFGVIITAIWGSSRHLIAGPSTGVAILIQATIADTMASYYSTIPQHEVSAVTMHILCQIVLIMGILQVGAGFFRLGKLLQFVSRSVILGYFAGVAIAIIVSQLYYFLGVAGGGGASVIVKIGYLLLHLSEINWLCFGVGVISLIILVVMKKKLPRLPNSLIMLIIITVVVFFINKLHFSYNKHVPNLQDMGFFDRPSLHFIAPLFDLKLINKIFPAALAITLLSILEVFSVSRDIAAKSGHNTNTNQEMFGVGVSNLFLSSLLGAMPASGSLSRSSFNFLNKAKTRVAAIMCGVFVAVLTIFGWPLIRHIPITGLAAILLALAPSLVSMKDIKLCFRATRGDSVVFILTFACCLIFSLDIAFFIGIVISIASYLRKAADPHLVEYAFNTAGRLTIVSTKKKSHRKIRIIGIGGELFFAVVDLLHNTLQEIAKDPYVQVIILRLNGVNYIDASTCFAIMRLHEYLKATNRHLVIAGISDEVWHTLFKADLINTLDKDNLYLADETKPQLSTWRGCLRAEELVE